MSAFWLDCSIYSHLMLIQTYICKYIFLSHVILFNGPHFTAFFAFNQYFVM